MKKMLLGTIVSLALLSGVAYSQTDENFFRKESGQWTVEGIKAEGLTVCAATTFWANGSYVTFYINSKDEANILAHNTEWNIADPVGFYKGYTATLNFFGKYEPDTGTIDYTLIDNQTIGFKGVNTTFLESWMKYDVMVIIMPGDIKDMKVGLGGTKEVTAYMGECLNIMKNKKSGQNT
jgi:Phr family secreted Rap phosphatase inhibitor